MRVEAKVAGLVALALAGCSAAESGRSREHWIPEVGASWQYQLSGRVDTNVDAAVYDIDGFENSTAVVAELHHAGRRAICYVDAGSWEAWRPDAAQFPVSVRGKALDGWPGERWLDIRQIDALSPLMAARFDVCQAKGFDGVEPDNVDGYSNATGFALSSADQIAYNTMLAGLAHDRGLAVGLKNDLDQVDALVGAFDFAVNEQCAQYQECDALEPFIAAGKPVFHVEYGRDRCRAEPALTLSSIRKKLTLDAWRQTC
jgi:hypothetical protein